MDERLEQERGARTGRGRRSPWLRRGLMLVALASLGLAWAQIPSGDPPPFIEADIEVEAEVDLPGGSTGVKGTVSINTDGLGEVLDVVISALCRIFPCKGDDAQAQALARTDAPRIGDERTGIILEGGAVGIDAFFGGLRVEEATYEWGFFVRFAPDSAVRIRSVSFAADALLTDAYLRELGLEGPHYVPAGTYYVLDRKLTVPVQRRR